MNVRGLGVAVAVASMALIVVNACSDDAGKMLTDAGQALMDAGQALVDSGGSVSEMDSAMAQGSSGFKNGSRIQMRSTLMAGADGSQTATVYEPFDTQLGVGCSVQRASDGRLRCLPKALSYGVPYFADAGCTLGVSLQMCTDQPLTYVLEQTSSNSCPADTLIPGFRVYRAGAEHTGAVYSRAGSSCIAVARPSQRTYLVGAEVAPTSFVEFTSAGSTAL